MNRQANGKIVTIPNDHEHAVKYNWIQLEKQLL